MASRKHTNGFRNFFICSLIWIICIKSFTETLVIPGKELSLKASQFTYNAVDLACPLPTKDHRQGPCLDKCTHDNECLGNKLCCSDGCQKACTDPLLPPAVVDWESAPTGHRVAGNNWLVEGPAPQAQGETCSTSTPGPNIPSLSCPEGFTCVIEDNGDPLRGIPNRGVCVQHSKETNTIPENELNNEKDLTGTRCILDGKELTDGEIFYRRCNMCACNRGYIICEVNNCSEGHTAPEDW